jgi:site-specific recombinase XerC
VPDEPVEVLTDDQLRRLLQVCAGREFDQLRDAANVRLFMDSGMRVGGMSGIRLGDVDFEAGTVYITEKGRRPRFAPFGNKTARQSRPPSTASDQVFQPMALRLATLL